MDLVIIQHMTSYIRIQTSDNTGAFYAASGKLPYGDRASHVMSALSNLTPLPYDDANQVKLGKRMTAVYKSLEMLSPALHQHLDNTYFFFNTKEFIRICSGNLTQNEKNTIKVIDDLWYNYGGISFLEDCDTNRLTINEFFEQLYDHGYELVVTNEQPIVEDNIQAVFPKTVKMTHVFSYEDLV
jgi:hypothetical protein